MAEKEKKNIDKKAAEKPSATDKKIEALNAELEKARAEAKEAADKAAAGKDDYLRLMAEFDTFRRRSAEEKLSLVSSAAADTIKGLLPVLDDCERAMQMLEGSSDAAAREGTSLIYNKLMEYLKSRGLSVIEARGQKFDTDFHEAVTQFPAPTEEQKGLVLDVVQTGYLLNGKILRYAKVVVGA
ncbi:MAG: nucleotide exchange factor GrpE [Bacteroidales bacterium]|nr:nucleotide exchange factor GrpE [Bacteroidales bacterium]